MHVFRIAAAVGLSLALAAPAGAAAPPAHSMMPKMSPQATAALQQAFIAMSGVTSGRVDLQIAHSALVTHVTFTKTPPAAHVQTTVGPTPFSDSIAIDGMLYQRIGDGTYGATRITNLVRLVTTLFITQMAMMPKHVQVVDPKRFAAMKPPTVTEKDAIEDGISVARLTVAVHLPPSLIPAAAKTAGAKAAKPVTSPTLVCSLAKTTGLPHRCAIGFAGQTFVTLAFSGWNDPANIVAAPSGVPTPPPDAGPAGSAAPIITPMPTMLPSTVHPAR